MPGTDRIGTIAGFALFVVSVVAAIGDAGAGRHNAHLSTPTPAHACTIAPRDPAFFATLVGVPPPPQESSLTDAFRAAADRADTTDIKAAQLVLDELAACINAGDFARTAALFTDDYWRREVDGFLGRARAFGHNARATPQPVPTDQQMLQPVIIAARALGDGRVGALIRLGIGTSSDSSVDLVAFRRVDGQWRIDEVVTNYRGSLSTTT